MLAYDINRGQSQSQLNPCSFSAPNRLYLDHYFHRDAIRIPNFYTLYLLDHARLYNVKSCPKSFCLRKGLFCYYSVLEVIYGILAGMRDEKSDT